MIREAEPRDYAALARIHAASFERGWKEEEIANLAQKPGSKTFVCEQEANIGGFVLLQAAADECEIVSIAVEKARRRTGIGRLLVAHVAEFAQRNGIKKLFLEVAEDNLDAIALYESAGYAVYNRRKAYYRRWHGRAVDALMMRLLLQK